MTSPIVWASLPAPVRDYLDLGEILNRNQLPHEATEAIRAARIRILEDLNPMQRAVLTEWGQQQTIQIRARAA